MNKSKVFYGYWIIAACCLFCLVSTGCALASFGFFIKPLETDFGWGRAEIMAAFTVVLLFMAITSPLFGRLVERYAARIVISLSAVVESIGFIILSQMDSLWHYYMGYAIVGIGLTGAAQVTTTYVVSQWFVRKRGMAIGIMSTGLGLAGIVYTPLVGLSLIPNLGWSSTYLILAMSIAVLIVPLSIFLIRSKPADIGLYPDGVSSTPLTYIEESTTSTSNGLTTKAAIATPTFWLIALAFLMHSTHLGVAQSQTPHLTDLGFPVSVPTTSFVLLAVTSVLGQFFYGWLCDRIAPKYATIISLSITAVAIIIFMIINGDSAEIIIWIYGALFGFGASGWLPTMSMLTSTTFGMVSYGTIFGLLGFFQSLGAGAGPLIAGAFFDVMGSFRWAFILILGLVILAIPIVLIIRRPNLHNG